MFTLRMDTQAINTDSIIRALDRACELAGGGEKNGAALARELGVSRMAVAQWRRRGVPVKRAIDLERLTRRLGEEIPRARFRPDLFLNDEVAA